MPSARLYGRLEMNVCYAVDLGGTAIKFGLFQRPENTGSVPILLEKWQVPTDISDNGRHIPSAIANQILQNMEKHQISVNETEGICIGVPSAVNEKGIITTAPNLGWKNMDLAPVLKELTGLDCHVLNDANAAALGEYCGGGGKDADNMVLLTLGTGIGGGVIINGNLFVGLNGAAGEIGHMCVNDAETIPCNCGNFGCLEQYSSASGIVRSYKEFSGSISDGKRLMAKDVFDAYNRGEEAAQKAIEKMGYYLGKACAAICCTISPEVIVLGGGVSNAGQVLIEVTSRYFRKFAFSACTKTRFVLAERGNDAGIYGCAFFCFK